MLPPLYVDHWDDYLLPLLALFRKRAAQPPLQSSESRSATTFIDDAGHGIELGKLPVGTRGEILSLLQSKKNKAIEVGGTGEAGLGVSYFTLQRHEERWVLSRTDINPATSPAASTSSVTVSDLGEVASFLEKLVE